MTAKHFYDKSLIYHPTTKHGKYSLRSSYSWETPSRMEKFQNNESDLSDVESASRMRNIWQIPLGLGIKDSG